MRIAVISNMVDPNVVPIYEELAKQPDCQLLVLFETDVEPNRRWSAPPLKFSHSFLKSHTVDFRRIHPDAFVHLTWGTRRKLARFKPDIVIGRGSGIWSAPANISAYFWRKRHGWRFVPWWESFGRKRPTLPRRLADRWIKRFLRNSDAILACGKRASEYLVSLGVPAERIVIAPHAVPASTSDLDINDLVDESVARSTKRILYVGQLIPRKGVDVLLTAYSDLSGFELWIAGDGELREEVLKASDRLAGIHFFGHLTKSEIMALYPQVDILAVPSRYEVWGLVVDEAQTVGRPVVATDQVGCADDLIVSGVTGEIVKAEDAEALALAIAKVADWSKPQLLNCAKLAQATSSSRNVSTAVNAYVKMGRDLGVAD